VTYNGSHTSRTKTEEAEATINAPIDDLFGLLEHNTLMNQRLELAAKTISVAF
jgi:hypothetical protein